MSARGVSLTGVYLFSTTCAVFATGYGVLALDPLAAQLYALALFGPLGFIWGATLRYIFVA